MFKFLSLVNIEFSSLILLLKSLAIDLLNESIFSFSISCLELMLSNWFLYFRHVSSVQVVP